MFAAARFELSLDILGEEVGFEVHAVADEQFAERCVGQRVGNEGHTEAVGLNLDERQTDAINGDRAFVGHLPQQAGRRLKDEMRPVIVIATLDQAAEAIDMAGNEVAAEAVAELERALEVDGGAFFETCEVRAA